MRRDKIFNVVCNHKISDHIKFKPFQNATNTLTWCARDFSEETEGLDELFALKFKVSVCFGFYLHLFEFIYLSE